QEPGRQALMDGHPLHALPYLLAAKRNGLNTVALRAMLTEAAFVPTAIVDTGADVIRATYNTDGTSIAVALNDGRALVLDAHEGKTLFEPRSAANWIQFDSSGMQVVTSNGLSSSVVRSGHEEFNIWNIANKSRILGPVKLGDAQQYLTFSKDGRSLFSM